ncbi:hypothetical protein M0657_007918 [Pyricularia oryzae]|uniref:Uncharacterized protein n=3 Tax=Pyricularia oryzae TaxID=318829 RepID=A0A4P7N2R7_PYROR|nr:hypothetical protein OOU_Y34scaffold00295g22 [Pyricularia oryzae Y34]KAI7917740.1 hypothetical protein M0657_007918 [Pyricularia oryzae]KAI7920989.1 hypothetical protein M9X92_005599 [Pyricularia oryzae]QBZ56603.1 hypothetical protein PoMZ_01513 [Pyricularia oryzae]
MVRRCYEEFGSRAARWMPTAQLSYHEESIGGLHLHQEHPPLRSCGQQPHTLPHN